MCIYFTACWTRCACVLKRLPDHECLGLGPLRQLTIFWINGPNFMIFWLSGEAFKNKFKAFTTTTTTTTLLIKCINTYFYEVHRRGQMPLFCQTGELLLISDILGCLTTCSSQNKFSCPKLMVLKRNKSAWHFSTHCRKRKNLAHFLDLQYWVSLHF